MDYVVDHAQGLRRLAAASRTGLWRGQKDLEIKADSSSKRGHCVYRYVGLPVLDQAQMAPVNVGAVGCLRLSEPRCNPCLLERCSELSPRRRRRWDFRHASHRFGGMVESRVYGSGTVPEKRARSKSCAKASRSTRRGGV